MEDKSHNPIPANEVVFHSLHDALAFRATEMTTGRFKKCFHLIIKERAQTPHYPYECMPSCIKHSLKVTKLRNGNNALIGCPENCLCYCPIWRGKVNKKKNAVHQWIRQQGKNIKQTTINTISSMHWLERVIIILVFLACKAPAILREIAPIIMRLGQK